MSGPVTHPNANLPGGTPTPEPQVTPGTTPQAPPVPIRTVDELQQALVDLHLGKGLTNAKGEPRKYDKLYDGARLEQLQKEIENRARIDNREPPLEETVEPLPVELESSLRKYDPETREAIEGHLETLLPMIDAAGIDLDSFNRLAVVAMSTANSMRAEDKYDITAEDAPDRCVATLKKMWGAQYDVNLTTVRRTVLTLGKDFADFLEATRYGDDAAFLQAILVHGRSGLAKGDEERSSSGLIAPQTRPTPSKVNQGLWESEAERNKYADEAKAKIDAYKAKRGGKL